jgi:serine/threonine protein kinase
MAPEVIKQADHNTISADIYSAGVFVFAMVTGTIPFQKATKSDSIYFKAISGDWDELWEFFINNKGCPRDVSEEFKDLAEKLLHYDPSKRLTLGEILQHEWCNGKVATSDEIHQYMSNRKEAVHEDRLKINSKPSIADSEGKYDFDSDSDEISESFEKDSSKSMKTSESVTLSKLFINKNAKVLFSSLKRFLGEKHFLVTPNPHKLSLLIEIGGKELISKIYLSISNPFGSQTS